MRPDPDIERLEADLRRSRFETWDVETFLADRHRAKIEALTEPDNRFGVWLQVAKELAIAFSALVGMMTLATMLGLWLLTGSAFPTAAP